MAFSTATEKFFFWLFFIITVVGALNWTLVSLANVNLVQLVTAKNPALEKAVYVAIGASAIGAVLLAVRLA